MPSESQIRFVTGPASTLDCVFMCLAWSVAFCANAACGQELPLQNSDVEIAITFEVVDPDEALVMFAASHIGQALDEADVRRFRELIDVARTESITFSVTVRNGEVATLPIFSSLSTVQATASGDLNEVHVQIGELFGPEESPVMQDAYRVSDGQQVLVQLTIDDSSCVALMSAEIVGDEETLRLDMAPPWEAYCPVLHGTVRDESGRPMTGVEVALYDKYCCVGYQHSSCVTDEKGEYRFSHDFDSFNMPRIRLFCQGSVQLWIKHPTHVAMVDWSQIRIPGIEGVRVRRDFTLIPGSTLRGRVVDERTGEPVPDLDVAVRRDDRNGFTVFYRRAATDADGRFSINTLYPQSYMVEAANTDNALPCEIYVTAGSVNEVLLSYEPANQRLRTVADSENRLQISFVEVDSLADTFLAQTAEEYDGTMISSRESRDETRATLLNTPNPAAFLEAFRKEHPELRIPSRPTMVSQDEVRSESGFSYGPGNGLSWHLGETTPVINELEVGTFLRVVRTVSPAGEVQLELEATRSNERQAAVDAESIPAILIIDRVTDQAVFNIPRNSTLLWPVRFTGEVPVDGPQLLIILSTYEFPPASD